MLPHILIMCFIATISLGLPLEKDDAHIPLDHSINTREETNPQNDIVSVETPQETSAEENSKDSSDEILDTANNIVFRPLFAYRQQVAQRRRVYQKKQNNNRRQSSRPQQYYPYGYPSYGYPYYMDREFPHVP